MKHIDIKYYAIWEWIKEEQIELQYISTEEQLADILTKSLPYERFKQLGSVWLPNPNRGWGWG